MSYTMPDLIKLANMIDAHPSPPNLTSGHSPSHEDSEILAAHSQGNIPMPPLEDTVAILRWAKGSASIDIREWNVLANYV